jgi:hypothetical protein
MEIQPYTPVKKGDAVEVIESPQNDSLTRLLIGKHGIAIKSHTSRMWTVKIDNKEVVLHSDEIKKL